MKDEERRLRRFGQGTDVDRSRPHLFHRDYVALREIRAGVVRFVEQHKAELTGKTILDYGAGDSPYGPMLERIGAKMIRADIAPVPEGVLEIGPDGRLPLADDSIDAVLSTQVLEHVSDVGQYLREAWRVLRPGGLLYLSTHGMYLLHRHPTDLWRWTIDGLRLELERHGFTVEDIVPRIGMLATATHHRSIAVGALTRRIPLTGWLRPVIYLLFNLRMIVEEWITPASATEAFPELLIATARK